MLLIFCPYSVYPVSQYGSPFFQLLLVILVDIIPSADINSFKFKFSRCHGLLIVRAERQSKYTVSYVPY
jgi:hypothetical protein